MNPVDDLKILNSKEQSGNYTDMYSCSWLIVSVSLLKRQSKWHKRL